MTVDRIHKQKISWSNPLSFKKIMKASCRNHGYPIKHNLEDCDLIKHYLKGDYKTVNTDKLAGPTNDEEMGDTFLA